MNTEQPNIIAEGKGGIKDASYAILDKIKLPLEYVDTHLFLSAIATCISKRLYEQLPQLKDIEANVKAYGNEEADTFESIKIEIAYRATGHVDVETVRRAAWNCPIILFLQDKIIGLTVKQL